MTTESKKPSERKPSDRYAEWPQNATPLDVNAMAFIDEHHARLTALEAAMATLTPPKPAADDEVVFKGIGNSVYAVVRDKYCVCRIDGTFSDWVSTRRSLFNRTIPRHEAEALRPAIRERFPVKAAAPSPQPSRSVEDEAREFYCQRHEGVRLRDVADWMVRDMIDFANQRTVAVEKERDEWKAKFEKLEARWNSDHAAVYAELSAARSERDAALAKVAELEKVLAAVRGVVK